MTRHARFLCYDEGIVHCIGSTTMADVAEVEER
jgi:hypothetical protein